MGTHDLRAFCLIRHEVVNPGSSTVEDGNFEAVVAHVEVLSHDSEADKADIT
jgi:hypothetical protein